MEAHGTHKKLKTHIHDIPYVPFLASGLRYVKGQADISSRGKSWHCGKKGWEHSLGMSVSATEILIVSRHTYMTYIHTYM
jgi:hypothetical protein